MPHPMKTNCDSSKPQPKYPLKMLSFPQHPGRTQPMDRYFPQASGKGMLGANPWRMGTSIPAAACISCWLPRCWQCCADKLGGGCCVARLPAAQGNCLLHPRPGPLLPIRESQHVSLARGEDKSCHQGVEGDLCEAALRRVQSC